MIPYSKKALDLVLRNKGNVEAGIPNEIKMGFPKLESMIYGVSQEIYYVVAGSTGSGKTKFIDLGFVLMPLSFVRKNPHIPIKVNIIYFSLEISAIMKSLNLASYYIFAKYGLSLSPSQIQSKDYKLSDEELLYVKEALDWVHNISDNLKIYEDSLTAKKLYAILKGYSEKHGTWSEKDPKTGEQTYTPNNPYLYTIIVIDHIGNVKQSGKGKKAEIDDISQYLVWFRNKCRFTPVVIMQFNRDLESTDRIKTNGVSPQLADLKESGNPSEDANTVLTLFSPLRFRLEEYRDYDIKKLQDNFRAISVLKNRDGPAEKTVGLAFFGQIGYFYELPRGIDMKEADYINVLNFLDEWKKRKIKKNLEKRN